MRLHDSLAGMQRIGRASAASGHRCRKRVHLPCAHPSRAPPPPPSRLGCVVFMHGILEHSYRYLHAFQLLASQGWAVAALDIRGHGLSDGTKGYLPDMYEAVADELQFLKLLQARKLAATGALSRATERVHLSGSWSGGGDAGNTRWPPGSARSDT